MRIGGGHGGRLRLGLIVALIAGGFFAFRQLVPDLDAEKLLEDLASSLGDLTYVLVGLLAFLETGAFVGLVFPGETAVILGGALAGQGENSVWLMLGVVWFCAWAGDSVSFLIGSKLGREFVLRHGPRVRITPERFRQVEGYFQRHGGKTILVGRFIGLVRALAPFIAGSSGMPYRAFVPYSILGTGLWAATFTLLGYFISESLNEATRIAGRGTLVFGLLVGAIVAVVLAVRFLREAENRRRAVAWIDSRPLLRPLAGAVRRLEPQLRFFWERLTPGGLGLELTALVAALSVSLFVLVAFASVVAADPGPTPGDLEAFDLAEGLRAPWLTDVTKAVTALGASSVTLAVATIAGVVLAVRRRWVEVGVLVAATLVIHLAVPLLKDDIARPRPGEGLVDVGGFAYPSGHAAYSLIYAWLALTIAIRVRPRMTHASALIATGIAVSVLVGLSRTYLHVHYLSDVAGGWALGVSAFSACAAIALVVTHLRGVRQNQRSP